MVGLETNVTIFTENNRFIRAIKVIQFKNSIDIISKVGGASNFFFFIFPTSLKEVDLRKTSLKFSIMKSIKF